MGQVGVAPVSRQPRNESGRQPDSNDPDRAAPIPTRHAACYLRTTTLFAVGDQRLLDGGIGKDAHELR